jgi:hypothetical protein
VSGPTGAQGPQGPVGPTGPSGPTGPKGPTGWSPTLASEIAPDTGGFDVAFDSGDDTLQKVADEMDDKIERVILATENMATVINGAMAANRKFVLAEGQHTLSAQISISAARVSIVGAAGSEVQVTYSGGAPFFVTTGASEVEIGGFVFNSTQNQPGIFLNADIDALWVHDIWLDYQPASVSQRFITTAASSTITVSRMMVERVHDNDDSNRVDSLVWLQCPIVRRLNVVD